MRNRYRAEDIQTVVGTDELCRELLFFAVGRCDFKSSALVADADKLRFILAVGIESVGYRAVGRSFGYIFIVAVQKQHAVLRQCVGELELRVDNILKRLKALEMLRTYRGYYAVLRVDYIAQFFYIADIFRAHLADEYFMRRSERAAHGLDDAHGSVVALGGHEDIVFCLEKSVEIELDARFAVASRDADNGKIRAGGEHFFRIVRVISVYRKLDGLINNIGEDYDKRRSCGNKTDGKRRYAPGREHREQDGYCNIEHRNGDEHTLDSGGIFQRLLRFLRLIEQAREQNKHGADYHAGILPADNADNRSDKRQSERNYLAAVLEHPVPLIVGAV